MKKGRNSGENDDEGKALWAHVTQSVRAYGRTRPPEAVPAGKGKPVRKASPPPRPSAPPERKYPASVRLDLHGMTQQEAFEALMRFIPKVAATGAREVLVITGKGPKLGGTLKKMLPLWLENPALSKYVHGASPADPKDGGAGAFYVRLKKK